jgi:hypothetical protein
LQALFGALNHRAIPAEYQTVRFTGLAFIFAAGAQGFIEGIRQHFAAQTGLRCWCIAIEEIVAVAPVITQQ